MPGISKAILGLSLLALPAAGGDVPFAVPARHRPKRIMGRDYYTALYANYDHSFLVRWKYRENPPDFDREDVHARWRDSALSVRRDNPDLNALPAFRDAVPVYHSQRGAPPPELGVATWRTLAENFLPGEPDAEIVTANPKPDVPLIVGFGGKRNILTYGGRLDLDYGEWKAWRAAHPNLLCCWSHIEWDNAVPMSYLLVKEVTDAKRRAEIEAFLGEKPANRYDRLKQQRRFYDHMKRLYYDDEDVTGVMYASLFTGHIAAGFGAKHLIIETTNTSFADEEYRWNCSAMFARGAARQFDLDWEWYVAAYMNGWPETERNHTIEREWGNVVAVYPHKAGVPAAYNCDFRHDGPDYGISRSLLRRAYYFAYLNGANIVELEEWSAQLLRWNARQGKTVLTPRGEDFVRYHDFTRSHPDRGAPYAPVAILVPYAQGYSAYGGYPWADKTYGYTAGDHAVDAVFFTLVPGFERNRAMIRGIETNLHNSPHAQMYDVLTPDSPQKPEEFLKALSCYRAAILVGDYPDRSFEKTLAEYERQGGRVIRIGTDEVPMPTGTNVVGNVLAGREKFPKVEKIVRKLQEAYFPFSVAGDCLYGANRTEKGWWLYVFNNRGVTKFVDTPQKIDPTAAEEVSVSSSKVRLDDVRELVSGIAVRTEDGLFRWRIGPGELAVFEIREK